MISYRNADILNQFKKRVYDCQLDLVFPVDENLQADSDRDAVYMGILDLKIDSSIPLNDYMKIRHKVNQILSPLKATIDTDSVDARKFYSEPTQSRLSFESKSFLDIENKILRIACSPVTDNMRSYVNDESIDRISIYFKIMV